MNGLTVFRLGADLSCIASSSSSTLAGFFRRTLKPARRAMGRRLEWLLIGREPVTIISDDCWGGEFCRSIGRAYTTPLAGVFIEPRDYLDFLENLRQPDAFHLAPAAGAPAYPVGKTPYATLHFLHAKSWEEVARVFPRRVARINGRRLFYKIDFGKSGYRQGDVDRWNALALPRAIALIPPEPRPGLDFARVHQAQPVERWIDDGIAMFHFSRRTFDFHYWVRTGRLRKSRLNRALNFLFWDAWMPSDLARKWSDWRRWGSRRPAGDGPLRTATPPAEGNLFRRQQRVR